MQQYSTKPRTRKYKKQLLDTGLNVSKTVVHKEGEYLQNKTVEAVTKSNNDNIVKQEPVEEMITNYTRKKRKNIKQTKKSIVKMEHYKTSKLLNDSTVSKLVTKKWVKVNELSSGQYLLNKNRRFKTSMLRS